MLNTLSSENEYLRMSDASVIRGCQRAKDEA